MWRACKAWACCGFYHWSLGRRVTIAGHELMKPVIHSSWDLEQIHSQWRLNLIVKPGLDLLDGFAKGIIHVDGWALESHKSAPPGPFRRITPLRVQALE